MNFFKTSYWMYAIPLVLFVSVFNGYIVYSAMQTIHHDALIVNMAGKIRGGIQRVSKLESNGISAHKASQEIDRLFYSLHYDHDHFSQDETGQVFKEELDTLQKSWNELQSLIRNYHTDPATSTRQKLIEVSELCWSQADETVKQAQIAAERKVSKIETLFYLLLFDFIVFAAIARYVSYLIRSVETKERNRLQQVMDANPHIILLKDSMGRFTLVNQAMADLYDTTKENMIGKDDEAFNSNTEQAAFYRKNVQEIISSGQPQRVFEESTDLKSGEVRYYESIKIPITNPDGAKNVLIIASDITKLKQSEQNLRKLLGEQEALLQIRTVGFIHVKGRRFLWTNEAFEQMLGYGEGELRDQATRVIYLNDADYEYIGEIGYQTLRERGIFTYEIKGVKKDGTSIDLIISLNAIENLPGEAMGVIIDITQQKTLESELIYAKELAEAATRSKSEFLANMSHEIRTPLNAIIGFIPLLKKRNSDSESKKYLGIIDKSASSLLEIVNDILDFSKINSQKLIIESHPFNPCEEMEGVIQLFAPLAKEKGVDIFAFIDPNMPEYLLGDSTRIKQIVNNLLSNAIKFTPENGTIRVRVAYNAENSILECAIKDSGIGMSEEGQKKIFHLFEQSDASITRKFGGTGLGLTICKSLCDLMGGTIQVVSQLNKGATFIVKLPLPIGVENVSEYHTAPFKGVRYFSGYVNTDEADLKLIEKYLESFGMECVESQNDAVFVLTDTKEISDVTFPVLYFSKSEDDFSEEGGFLYGIHSPILPCTLLETLNQVLGKGDPQLEQ
ncbi:MAG: ATP-binding protein [Sulfuricurvum sp.]|nr:ATP-binding protein [Sulfuricurvum sp.]